MNATAQLQLLLASQQSGDGSLVALEAGGAAGGGRLGQAAQGPGGGEAGPQGRASMAGSVDLGAGAEYRGY
eukprot:XP_001691421.1 predicted protein [Chlamydomonas reinhardtii]